MGPKTKAAPKKEKALSDEEKLKSAEELRVKGNDFLKTGDIVKAADYYSQALELTPGDARLYSNRSYVYLHLHFLGNAIWDAERAIEFAPQWPKGYYRLGAALIACRDYWSAKVALDKANELSGRRDPTVLMELAKAEKWAQWFYYLELYGPQAAGALGFVLGILLWIGENMSKPDTYRSPVFRLLAALAIAGFLAGTAWGARYMWLDHVNSSRETFKPVRRGESNTRAAKVTRGPTRSAHTHADVSDMEPQRRPRRRVRVDKKPPFAK